MADSYSQGDLVGISIDKVDRTNCDAKLMPCIIDERVNQGATPTFRLICPFGRLSSLFPLHHLFRITSPVPDSLVNVHGTNIPTVSFVQACKMYARRGKCTNADWSFSRSRASATNEIYYHRQTNRAKDIDRCAWLIVPCRRLRVWTRLFFSVFHPENKQYRHESSMKLIIYKHVCFSHLYCCCSLLLLLHPRIQKSHVDAHRARLIVRVNHFLTTEENISLCSWRSLRLTLPWRNKGRCLSFIVMCSYVE